MKERSDNSQEYLTNIYEKGAGSLATMAVGKFKESRAKGQEFVADIWNELLLRTKDSLKGQLSFSPDVSRLERSALEKLMLLRKEEPELAVSGFKFFTDKYLEVFKEGVIADALTSGLDFYDLLGQRLREAGLKGVDFDNDLVNKLKIDWADEYYARLSRVA